VYLHNTSECQDVQEELIGEQAFIDIERFWLPCIYLIEYLIIPFITPWLIQHKIDWNEFFQIILPRTAYELRIFLVVTVLKWNHLHLTEYEGVKYDRLKLLFSFGLPCGRIHLRHCPPEWIYAKKGPRVISKLAIMPISVRVQCLQDATVHSVVSNPHLLKFYYWRYLPKFRCKLRVLQSHL